MNCMQCSPAAVQPPSQHTILVTGSHHVSTTHRAPLAGTWAGRSDRPSTRSRGEGLYQRFNKYATTTRVLLGPAAEHEKDGMFRALQRRGFLLYYR